MLGQARLDVAKAALEFVVGSTQRRLGIDPAMSGEVGDGEQDVAQLVCDPSLVDGAGGQLGAEFAQFFLDFVDDRAGLFPVEADPGRSLLDLLGTQESRKGLGDPIESARGLLAAFLGALGRLAGLPGDCLGVGIGDIQVAENVRMPVDHLLCDGLGHVGEVERPGLAGHLRVVDHLQEQIAQFLLERRHIVTLDGVGDLVGFLDRVWRNRPEGLVDVPRAAMLTVAQPRHDGQEAGQRLAGKIVRGRLLRHLNIV